MVPTNMTMALVRNVLPALAVLVVLRKHVGVVTTSHSPVWPTALTVLMV